MSIKDTITAARQEVQDAGSVPVGKRESTEEDTGSKSAGGRRSAARAKPARDAASSVRVISSDDAKAGKSGKRASEMSRQERKAEREIQRSEQDMRTSATEVLLKRQEAYRRGRKLWWILLSAGIVFTVLSIIVSRMYPPTSGGDNTPTMVAIVLVAIAYICIIVAFVYDWRKIKPMRTAANEEANRLSRKKIRSILHEDAAERAAKKRRG